MYLRKVEDCCVPTGPEHSQLCGAAVVGIVVIFTDTQVSESDEDKPGVILDYDDAGNLVSLEILDASQRVGLPTQIEYQLVPAGSKP